MKRQLSTLCLACGTALFIVSCGDESTTNPDTDNTPDNTVIDEDTAGGDSMAEVDGVDEMDTVDTAADEDIDEPSDDSTTFPDETGDGLVSDEDGLVPDDTDPNCQPGAFPEVCGSWAQQMIFTATAKVAGFDAASAEIRTLFLMTQRQQDGHLWIDSKICHIVIENTSTLKLININMPPSFAAGLLLLHKEADITLAGEYYQAPYWEMRSIKQSILPTDPSTYELPTDPASPDVEDWDNDGTPGLRVLVSGTLNGTTHIVEKSSSELWGQVNGTGETQTIEGTVAWTDKQVVLSTDNGALKGGAQNVIDEDGANIWRQKRIDPLWTCTEVMANGDTLFPPL